MLNYQRVVQTCGLESATRCGFQYSSRPFHASPWTRRPSKCAWLASSTVHLWNSNMMLQFQSGLPMYHVSISPPFSHLYTLVSPHIHPKNLTKVNLSQPCCCFFLHFQFSIFGVPCPSVPFSPQFWKLPQVPNNSHFSSKLPWQMVKHPHIN